MIDEDGEEIWDRQSSLKAAIGIMLWWQDQVSEADRAGIKAALRRMWLIYEEGEE